MNTKDWAALFRETFQQMGLGEFGVSVATDSFGGIHLMLDTKISPCSPGEIFDHFVKPLEQKIINSEAFSANASEVDTLKFEIENLKKYKAFFELHKEISIAAADAPAPEHIFMKEPK